VAIAVFAIEVFGEAGAGVGSFDFGHGGVQVGNMFLEVGCDGLANQVGGHIHIGEACAVALVLWSSSVTVDLLQTGSVDSSGRVLFVAVICGWGASGITCASVCGLVLWSLQGSTKRGTACERRRIS